MKIPDSEPLRAFGRRFEGYPVAQQPPSVIVADSIGSDRFFHGEIMARWAEDWDRIYSRGNGKARHLGLRGRRRLHRAPEARRRWAGGF